MKKPAGKFEDAISELENIVEALEKGELSLDESIDLFQKGVELSKFCSKRLDEIEKKITMLIEDDKGELNEVKFNITNDAEA